MDSKLMAQRLIRLRGENSQQKVAEDLGITASSIAEYEQGKRIPHDALKMKIAEYYGVSFDWLFFDD